MSRDSRPSLRIELTSPAPSDPTCGLQSLAASTDRLRMQNARLAARTQELDGYLRGQRLIPKTKS
jgi:hypothetical protein